MEGFQRKVGHWSWVMSPVRDHNCRPVGADFSQGCLNVPLSLSVQWRSGLENQRIRVADRRGTFSNTRGWGCQLVVCLSSPHPAGWSEVPSGLFGQLPPSASPRRSVSDLAPQHLCRILLEHNRFIIRWLFFRDSTVLLHLGQTACSSVHPPRSQIPAWPCGSSRILLCMSAAMAALSSSSLLAVMRL